MNLTSVELHERVELITTLQLVNDPGFKRNFANMTGVRSDPSKRSGRLLSRIQSALFGSKDSTPQLADGVFETNDEPLSPACKVGVLPSDCNPGQFYENEACKPCDQGMVQGDAGQTHCNECTEGTFQSRQGQTNCNKCALGAFTDTTRQLFCPLCSAGFYQDLPQATSCHACPQRKEGMSIHTYMCVHLASIHSAQKVKFP